MITVTRVKLLLDKHCNLYSNSLIFQNAWNIYRTNRLTKKSTSTNLPPGEGEKRKGLKKVHNKAQPMDSSDSTLHSGYTCNDFLFPRSNSPSEIT